MSNLYITASGSQNVAKMPRRLRITVNTALTGTITVTDAGVTIAVITNPAVGNAFTYSGKFAGQVAVNPSATCDITVSVE